MTGRWGEWGDRVYVLYLDGKPFMQRNSGNGFYYSRKSAERALAYFRGLRGTFEIKAFDVVEVNE